MNSPAGGGEGEGAATPARSGPELKLLGRIRARMADNLDWLPDYVCEEIIERTSHRPNGKLYFNDRIRVEVAIIGGVETFAWPGAGKFQETRFSALVPGGATGNGDFGMFAHNVFRSSGTLITQSGRHQLDGRPAIQFSFRVPLLASGYHLKVGTEQARISYAGVFWVDADTLDLIRMKVEGGDLPDSIDCARIGHTIRYGRVQLANSEFLLPLSAERVSVDRGGNESRSLLQFTRCRQYSASSSISFGAAPESPLAASQPPLAEARLPAGIPLELRLEGPIEFGKSAVGDPIQGRLAKSMSLPDGSSFPKDAVVSGRLRRFEYRSSAEPIFVIGFEFFAVASAGNRATFSAKLIGPEWSGHPPLDILDREARPGVGVVRFRGRWFHLPRNLRMEWVTN